MDSSFQKANRVLRSGSPQIGQQREFRSHPFRIELIESKELTFAGRMASNNCILPISRTASATRMSSRSRRSIFWLCHRRSDRSSCFEDSWGKSPKCSNDSRSSKRLADEMGSSLNSSTGFWIFQISARLKGCSVWQ